MLRVALIESMVGVGERTVERGGVGAFVGMREEREERKGVIGVRLVCGCEGKWCELSDSMRRDILPVVNPISEMSIPHMGILRKPEIRQKYLHQRLSAF